MCYTIEINLTREQLEKRYKAQFDSNAPFKKRQAVSAFTLPQLPIICEDNPEEIKLVTWGLIPFWTEDEDSAEQVRMKTFNAKSETLAEKPSFRHTLKNQKCLVLINGFYEWQDRGKEKIPHYISLKDIESFALAGLYDDWTNKKTGEMLRTFTVITSKANELMEQIHNSKKRMPVILEPNYEFDWLKAPEEKVKEILKPFDTNKMKAIEAESELFGKKKPESTQGSLF